MVFKLTADIEFEAKDIEDAFRVLSNYFAKMDEEGLDAESILLGGHISVKELKEERND